MLDTTTADYASYIEWVDPTFFDGDLPQTRPSDLNLPSISFSKFAGKDSTTRVFKSIDSTATRWTVSFEGLAGVNTTASTGQFFTIKPGQTQPITVTLQNSTAALNKYAFGALVLTSGSRVLRVPISVKPIPIAAPTKVTVNTAAAAGSQPITVTTGYTGFLSGVGWGLAAPTVQRRQADHAPRAAIRTRAARDPGTQLYPLTVPNGSQLRLGEAVERRRRQPEHRPRPVPLPRRRRRRQLRQRHAGRGLGQLGLGRGHHRPAPAGRRLRGGGRRVHDRAGRVGLRPVDLGHQRSRRRTTPSNPPAITVTGDKAVTAGVPATLTLNWSGVAAAGLYRGLATYHASQRADDGATSPATRSSRSTRPAPRRSRPAAVDDAVTEASPEGAPTAGRADRTRRRRA